MKSFWFFFLLSPLFGMSYCSIVSNVVSQPFSLSNSDLVPIAKWQMDNFRTNEPFAAYNKLNDGTLELFGTAFSNEVTSEMTLFLKKKTSIFKIHSVIFKWFYFDKKMLKIFDVFHKKLRKSVKSVTFEKCYFPEGLLFKSSLELNYVTKCSFIDCFSNEESFKAIFKIFKKESVTSLTISRVFDYKQDESVNTNVALKSMIIGNNSERSVKINALELDTFFADIKFLSLAHSTLDFDHFSLTRLNHLVCVDLSNAAVLKLYIHKLFERLPTNLKRVKVFFSYYCYTSSFIKNACDKKVIIDTDFIFDYVKSNCVKALSVFSSVHFNMDQMNDKMTAIKEYVESDGGVIDTVTSVKFYMTFNHENITNMMTLLKYFPKLDNIIVSFIDDCDASINEDQILQLFSTLPVIAVEKLSIFFEQKNETTAFYCFIVELMKMCQDMTSLEFHYSKSNSFANNIKEMVKGKDIQFTNLNVLAVEYNSIDVNISVDLFYVVKYNIKTLTLNLDNLESSKSAEQFFDELKQFKYLPIDNLSFCVPDTFAFSYLTIGVSKKCPRVTNLSWNSKHISPIFSIDLQKMKLLKNVVVKYIVRREDFPKLLSQLSQNLESLEIGCSSYEIKEIEKSFYEKFPTATLTMNVV